MFIGNVAMCAKSNFVGNKVFIAVVVLLVSGHVRGKTKRHDNGHLSDRLINELYQKYKEAVSNDADFVILRRLFDHNRLFEIHVKKLKEVNGLKQHNLMIKGKPRSGQNPFIYINNPVESKIPNAYLTLEEFKEALTKRVEKQRYEATTKSKHIVYLNANKMTRVKSKKVTRTHTKSPTSASGKKKQDVGPIISSLYDAPEKDIMLRASDVKDTKKSKKKTLPTEFSVDISTTASQASTNGIFKKSALSTTKTVTTKATQNEFKSSPNSQSVKLEAKSIPISRNEELIVFNPAVENTDSPTRSTKVIEPIPVTRTTSIDHSRTELRTNSQAIEPKNYSTNKMKSVSTNIDKNNNSISNIWTKDITSEMSGKTAFDTSKETLNTLPNQLVINTESVTPIRQTPKRRSTLNKTIIKNKSIITKRTTLGRPLVFIGGP